MCIHIRVPASSGNLGPGFDTLGIAVNIHNQFDIRLIDSRDDEVEVSEGIDPALHPLCLNMVRSVGDIFFEKVGVPRRCFYLRTGNRIPLARGLASSATIRLAVLAGLDRLLQTQVQETDLVKWAAELEGSTDNVASCYYGGVTASGIVRDRLVCFRFDIDEAVDFVAVSPTSHVETDKARKVFPDRIARSDAIHNLNRGTLLAMAFACRDYEGMRDLFEDRLHQPFRQANIPALRPLFDVIEAAVSAGAVGAFLSGSGSTVMALTLQGKEAVARGMQAAFAKYEMESDVRFLKADNQGIVIEPPKK